MAFSLFGPLALFAGLMSIFPRLIKRIPIDWDKEVKW